MPSSLHMGISVKLLSIRYGVNLLAERWQLPALWGGANMETNRVKCMPESN